ncbi:MAG: phosphotransferase family protein [Candidatus Thorarchaeota archaeon]|jgi:aminoglycoside phosphotransferase (APT) family kinase protein
MKDNQRKTDIDNSLLSYLGSELDNQQLTYVSLPTPVKGGFDTRIFSFQLKGASFELSQPLILRLFGKSSQNRATFESAVQNAVASSGCPAPRVFFTCIDESVLGGSFMIMELMPGQTMANMPVTIMSETLAKAHLRLHSLNVESVRSALEVAGIRQDRYSIEGRLSWLVEGIESSGFEWLQPGLRWIVENRPEDPERLVICHGDFHPFNILIKDSEVCGVLDWSGFLISDPAYDIGITQVLGTVAAPSLFPEINWVQMFNRYYDYYQGKCPVDPIRVEYYEALKCLWALLEGAEGHAAWGHPETNRRLSEHFEKITSVRLALPKAST